jgi:hypothetical protein
MSCEPSGVLVRRDFGSVGLEYVRAYLESNEGFGKQLGRLLLDHHEIEKGTAWAYVPDPVLALRGDIALTDFESGGVDPTNGPSWPSIFEACSPRSTRQIRR